MLQLRSVSLVALLLAVPLVAPAFASDAAKSAVASSAANVLTPHRVADLKLVNGVAMSPDGKLVAYTLSVPRKPLVDDDGGNWTELWIVAREGGEPRAYISGKNDLGQVQWLPDGSGVAFVAKRGDDKASSLYVMPVGGGESRRALAWATNIQAYSFASDGKRVAFVATDADSEARKKAQEKGFKAEIYEEDVKRAKLFVGEIDSPESKPKEIALDGSVHQVQWSPVDDRLLVSIAPTPLVDDEYMAQEVVVVSEGEIRATFERDGKLGAIEWSPDGRRVALLAGADINDPSDGRLFVGDASGGKLTQLAAEQPFDFDAFAWHGPSDLMAVVSRGTETSFLKISADGATTKAIVPAGKVVLTALSLSSDGQHAAFIGSTSAHPGELFTMSHGDAAPARRSSSNPWLAEMRLAKQETITWKARDGAELEGILIHPLDRAEGARVPLIVYVHGGPEAHEQNGWQTSYSKPGHVAAARGFAVFHPNYRGSTGRGLAFSKLSQGDPAGKEFDDIVDGVDHLVRIGLVDAQKVGITGGSYGGYATAWCSTRYSDRFAAGVMFVGISDKISKVGTTDIPNEEFHVHARHRVWDDWSFFLERSPIKHAGQCKTPLLILHGKDDPRVNPGQSRELYRHLKLRSQAPVRLVLYPGEGHGNRKAASKLDYHLRMLQWMEQYLSGPGGPPPAWELDYADPATKKDAG